MDVLRGLAIFIGVLAAALACLRVMRPLPGRASILPTFAAPPASDGALATAIAEMAQAHPGKTGVVAVASGGDALASRVALARLATRSIDVQYYIWHDDVSGRLLLHELYQATLRGCRVRLLVDDNGVDGLDQVMATLDAQPDFEIRIFNPSTTRKPKLLGFAYDFLRMNRRMHNKSFTVDGVATIVGGRNIGDEYFDIGDEALMLDLDVIAIGAVVGDVVAAFDLYWNSRSVYPASLIVDPRIADLPAFVARGEQMRGDARASELLRTLSDAAHRLVDNRAAIEWTQVRLFVDDPSKGEGKAKGRALMITQLGEILYRSARTIDLVSAYFIPGKSGSAMFEALARRGVLVRILTNAFSTTDVKVVHSGYIKCRKRLLRAGVQLLELRPGLPGAAGRPAGVAGSSSASLHAKTFAIDGEHVFIGSFNFDPRSAHLNCEMGLLIDSAGLAQRLDATFDDELPKVAYQPAIEADGGLGWRDAMAPGAPLLRPEPDTTGFDRLLMRLVGLLPIERWL